MWYTESQLREYLIDFLANSSLMYCFEANFSINFLREFVGHVDMDEVVCRLYNTYRYKTPSSNHLTFANWIDVTEPKLKEFLSKDRKRLWDSY